MTRPCLALIAGVLLLCGVAINAPTPLAEAAAIKPSASWPLVHTSPPSIRFGDGIFQLRIQLCERCGAQLTLEITLPHIARPEGRGIALTYVARPEGRAYVAVH